MGHLAGRERRGSCASRLCWRERKAESGMMDRWPSRDPLLMLSCSISVVY